MSDLDVHQPATAGDDPPPPLTVSGPAGRVAVELATGRHTIGELADVLGIPRRAVVVVDGQPVDRRVRLDRSGVANGSRVAGRPSRTTCRPARSCEELPDDDPAGGRLVVTVEAGPDAGGAVVLPPGRHLIGRSAGCAIRFDDPFAELHHAVLDVGVDSSSIAPPVVQLAGRVPCRNGAAADEPAGESVVLIGASRVRVAVAGPERPSPPPPAAALSPTRGDPWRSTLHRPPRRPAPWTPTPIEPPCSDSTRPLRSAGGLLAGVMSVVGGVVLAVAMHHPMYLIFSCLGFVAAVVSALGTRLGDRRRRRRGVAESLRDVERFGREVAAQHDARAAHARSTSPTVAAALRVVTDLTSELWARRADDDDAFAVSLGWGSMPWTADLARSGADLSAAAMAIIDRHALLDGVPVTAHLGPGQALAIVGDNGVAVARALLLQLAVLTGPADWRLVVIADDPDEWEWVTWLPHVESVATSDGGPLIAAADDGTRLTAILARLESTDDRHVVVLTDRPDTLSARTGALRRYLAGAPSVAVIAVVEHGGTVPPLCRSELRIGSLCAGRWSDRQTDSGRQLAVHAAGVTLAVACDAARRLARIHDPEDPIEVASACPMSVALSRVLARSGPMPIDDSIGIAATWRSRSRHRGGAGDGHPRAAIGVGTDGVVEIDLVADGPHALIAGTTGAGKSELLRTLVVALAASTCPDDLTFVLVDYKGGSTFDACAELPHTVGVVTDLDDRLAERALVSLEAEIRRRERLLRQAGVDDLSAYRLVAAGDRPLPRLVVVVDEFATLAADLPDFLPSLVGVAQRGRSLGIHLVLATQRPAGVVSDEIRANTNLRIALRLQDRADALDIVGSAEPASFPRGVPGRAMLRLGAGETVVFQTAHSAGEHRSVDDDGLRIHRPTPSGPRSTPCLDTVTELAALTRAIRAAASLCEVAPPFRPWLDPLPTLLPATTLDDDAVGIVDDPATQRQVPLRWDRRAGNLALIGSLGSGTTTALRTLLVAGGPAAHCYVVDARGDELLDDVAALPNCGAVVGLHEAERRTRLVRFLSDELTRRRADPAASRSPIVVAIDGLGALLAALAGPADVDEHGSWLRVLTDGAALGIHTIATTERPGAVPHTAFAALPQRWLFHVDDPLECVGLGVRAAAVPPPTPGRIMIVDRRLEAQLAVLAVPSAPPAATTGRAGRHRHARRRHRRQVAASVDSSWWGDGADDRRRLRDARASQHRGPRWRARSRRRAGAQWPEYRGDPPHRRLAHRPPGRHRRGALPAAVLARCGVGDGSDPGGCRGGCRRGSDHHGRGSRRTPCPRRH